MAGINSLHTQVKKEKQKPQTKQTQENTKWQQKILTTTTKNPIVSKILLEEFGTVPEKSPPQNTNKSLSKTGLIIPLFIQDGLKINTITWLTLKTEKKFLLCHY